MRCSLFGHSPADKWHRVSKEKSASAQCLVTTLLRSEPATVRKRCSLRAQRRGMTTRLLSVDDNKAPSQWCGQVLCGLSFKMQTSRHETLLSLNLTDRASTMCKGSQLYPRMPAGMIVRIQSVHSWRRGRTFPSQNKQQEMSGFLGCARAPGGRQSQCGVSQAVRSWRTDVARGGHEVLGAEPLASPRLIVNQCTRLTARRRVPVL